MSRVFQENFIKSFKDVPRIFKLSFYCNFVAWISSQLPEQKEGLFWSTWGLAISLPKLFCIYHKSQVCFLIRFCPIFFNLSRNYQECFFNEIFPKYNYLNLFCNTMLPKICWTVPNPSEMFFNMILKKEFNESFPISLSNTIFLNFFWICHESIRNVFNMILPKFFFICLESARNVLQ